jgi:transcription elongation factor B subunit 2
MVRRKKTTIFLDAKETTTVLDLKKMIEGITKKSPSDQQIYNKDDVGRL